MTLDIQLESKENAAVGYRNLGTMYFFQGRFDRAEEMFDSARQINYRIGCKEGLAGDYESLAYLYLRLSNRQKAVKYFQSASVLFKLAGMRERSRRIEARLGRI